MKRPEAFPWEGDTSNYYGWYDKREMDAYLEYLQAREKILLDALTKYRSYKAYDPETDEFTDNAAANALEKYNQAKAGSES
jgi:hypothetical protein